MKDLNGYRLWGRTRFAVTTTKAFKVQSRKGRPVQKKYFFATQPI